MITIESTLTIDEDKIAELFGDQLEAALVEGAEPIEQAARANLVDHQSMQTGTTEKQTDKSDSQRDRDPLIESITHESFQEGNRVVVLVGVDEPAARVGIWREFGHASYQWGRPAGRVDGDPFLRPAFFSNLREVVVRTAQRLKRRVDRD